MANQHARKPCPGCGEPIRQDVTRCRACHIAAIRSNRHNCPGCGGTKSPDANVCRKCMLAGSPAYSKVCPECGGAKWERSEMCSACFTAKRAAKAAAAAACACGRPKQPKSRLCMQCRHGEHVAATEAAVRARLEDVEWLIETGEWAGRVAARVGMRPDSLDRFLRRHGRDDLANYVAPAAIDFRRSA